MVHGVNDSPPPVVTLLNGHMLRHIADRARSETKGEKAQLRFHFDH
jgi:hypothetical protein